MADFETAYSLTIRSEGGYVLTNDPRDTGKQTYAGISRKFNPQWIGWHSIDRGDTPDTNSVREFYRKAFWNRVNGDSITTQDVANNIYDFAVNAGVKTAIKLAQIVVGVQPDGVIGPKSMAALNSIDGQVFKMAYALAKIARYRDIVQKNKSQRAFLLGWINRSLDGVA